MQDEALDREDHARATLHRLRVRPLRSNQPPVPAHDRVGCDDRRELLEEAAAEQLALGSDATALVVREPQPLCAELLPENSVPFAQVVDRALLLAVDPSGDGEEEGAEGIYSRRASAHDESPVQELVCTVGHP